MARPRDFDENEVLSKAVGLFWHKGYNGTSVEDLLETLNLSRSSLYRTYKDKHTLFLKALENYQQFSSSEIKGVIKDTDSVKETIRKLLEFIAAMLINDEKNRGCFMVNSEVEMGLHDKEVHNMVLVNDQELEDTFYYLLKKGKENGEIGNSNDVRAMARFFLNNAKGIRVTAKSTSDKKVFADIIEIALSTLD